MKKDLPLIIVFYIGRYMFETPQIIQEMSLSVESLINSKGYNAIAFFLPTNNEERVECINPIILSNEEYSNVEKLLKDLETNFDIKK